MELRRVGDALLRSQRLSLTFLTPSMQSRHLPIANNTLNSSRRKQLRRPFTSSARSAIARFAPVTTTASPPAQNADSETSEKPSKPLDWLTRTSSSGTGQSSSPQAQADNPASSPYVTGLERLMNNGNSARDLLASLNAQRTARSSKTFSIDSMLDPMTPKAARSEVADIMKDVSKEIHSTPLPSRAPMRLTPSTGRTVYVTPQVDVSRSFKLVGQLVARNKVKSTFNYQRFHERPGLKRKRLKSMRWRKRFMAGFKAAVNRVKQLKKQGW